MLWHSFRARTRFILHNFGVLNISEIFYSIQGEGSRTGLPCVFVRVQGCKLRCSWCDTTYALDHRNTEQQYTVDQVLLHVQKYNCRFVELTGGEPLEQPEVLTLMRRLCDMGYTVAVETGGHVDISSVDERVIRIVDIKCPDSKMAPLNRLENIGCLKPPDEVKFVIGSRGDYEYARDVISEYRLTERVNEILMSAVFGVQDYRQLVEWILEDALPVRFQLQIHKYIWDPAMRGV